MNIFPERYRHISRISAVRNFKRFLVVWVAGSAAQQMELLSDDEVIEHSLKVLQMVKAFQHVPHPERIIR